MGSSTKTVKGVSASFLQKREHDMFIAKLLYLDGATNGNLNASFDKAIDDATVFFNKNLFKNKGLLADSSMKIETVDETVIQEAIEDEVGSIDDLICYRNLEDNSRLNYLLYDFFKSQDSYIDGSNSSINMEISCNGNTYVEELGLGYITIDNNNYTVVVQDNSFMYYDDEDTNIRYIKLVNIDDDTDENKLQWYIDDRHIYYAKYNKDSNEDSIFIPEEDLKPMLEEKDVLILPIKIDSAGEADNNFFILNKFGIGRDLKDGGSDLNDTYSNSDIKNMIVTYAMKASSDEFIYDKVKPYYFDDDIGKTVTINSNYDGHNVKIEYYIEVGSDADKHTIKMYNNGDYKGKYEYDNENPFYIIPIETLQKLNLKDKYRAYRDYLSMFVSVTQKIHLKWYQTWWGQLLMVAVSALITYATGGAGAGLTTLIVGSLGVAINQFAPELSTIFSVILMVVSMANTMSSVGSIFTDVNQIMKFSGFLLNEYYDYKLGLKKDDVNELNKEMKKYQEEYDKSKENSYILPPPEELFNDSYNMLHNPFDIAYSSVHSISSTADAFYAKI